MHIGFTGTRRGLTEQQATALKRLLESDMLGASTFHHGSCQGADVEAARIVRQVFSERIRIVCHPGPDGDHYREQSGVDDETVPSKTHFARNRDIVDACEQLLACPCDMEEQPRGGTWYTIGYARKSTKFHRKGKPVVIIWPDGALGRSLPLTAPASVSDKPS